MSTQTGSITERKHNKANILFFQFARSFNLLKQLKTQSCVISFNPFTPKGSPIDE